MFRPGQTQHCMQMTLRFNTEKCKVQTVQYQGNTTQGNTTQHNTTQFPYCKSGNELSACKAEKDLGTVIWNGALTY
jgi:hypothetical protein